MCISWREPLEIREDSQPTIHATIPASEPSNKKNTTQPGIEGDIAMTKSKIETAKKSQCMGHLVQLPGQSIAGSEQGREQARDSFSQPSGEVQRSMHGHARGLRKVLGQLRFQRGGYAGVLEQDA